ncbi:MAG: hypothetical protein ACTTKF_03740 [Bacteroides sp.]
MMIDKRGGGAAYELLDYRCYKKPLQVKLGWLLLVVKQELPLASETTALSFFHL